MILGLIPARGGSKGIFRKNIKIIKEKPLIAWTIGHAKKSKLINRIVASTEDDEIAKVASTYGVEVLKRPAEIASNTASTLSVLEHAIKNIHCNMLVLLQPTSPIRSDKLIDESIEEFLRVKPDSLATGFYCNYIEYGRNTKRRQDIKEFFYDDGNLYIIDSNLIKKGERHEKKNIKKIISQEENIDIDNEFDFWLAEKILTERHP